MFLIVFQTVFLQVLIIIFALTRTNVVTFTIFIEKCLLKNDASARKYLKFLSV